MMVRATAKGEASSHGAQTGKAYPGFRSIKQLGIYLLPLNGMVVHRRVPFPALCHWYPFIHLGGERHYES